jgi:hypothetical protein
MTKQRICANDKTLPDEVSQKIKQYEERLSLFCEWFDVEPPELVLEDGDVQITDELLDWFDKEGASLDWIFCDEPKIMAIAYREKWKGVQSFLRTMKKFDGVEQKLMLPHLERIAKDEVTVDEGMGAFKADLEAYRSKGANLPNT